MRPRTGRSNDVELVEHRREVVLQPPRRVRVDDQRRAAAASRVAAGRDQRRRQREAGREQRRALQEEAPAERGGAQDLAQWLMSRSSDRVAGGGGALSGWRCRRRPGSPCRSRTRRRARRGRSRCRPCPRARRCGRAGTSATIASPKRSSVSAIILLSNGPGAIAFTVMCLPRELHREHARQVVHGGLARRSTRRCRAAARCRPSIEPMLITRAGSAAVAGLLEHAAAGARQVEDGLHVQRQHLVPGRRRDTRRAARPSWRRRCSPGCAAPARARRSPRRARCAPASVPRSAGERDARAELRQLRRDLRRTPSALRDEM